MLRPTDAFQRAAPGARVQDRQTSDVTFPLAGGVVPWIPNLETMA